MNEKHQYTPPLRQPKGLWVIFITEMWERFSYYGMRALLVLYLISSTSGDNPGFGWTESDAYKLYGWYTGFVYLTPIVGGWLADRWLGTHRSLLIGGWIIAAGHICLALTEAFGHSPTDVITFQTAPGPFLSFMGGLALIVIGTGFFKPCAAGMVGQLYARNDPRRDSGFTIFYMGVNVGAFLSGVVAGTLGEKVGWHWGFGSAAVGMVAGLLCYQVMRNRYLGNIGLPPGREQAVVPIEEREDAKAMARREQEEHERTRPLTRVDWERMAVILILAGFAIAFWVAFEQAGTSLNVFALEKTDRVVAGYEFPATWYQSVNPLAIVVLAPLFAGLWVWLDQRRRQPSTPVKFSVGIMLLAIGYIPMVIGAMQADGGGLTGPQWLFLTYVLHTCGELCLSPVGLSMVTKLSPARHTSLMLGLYYGSYFISNLAAGYVASFSKKVEAGEVFTFLGGQADFFLFLSVMPFVVGLVVLVLAPRLKRMMHGVQ
jgi:proton-dependent oligopeptide transporter, POT family